MSKSVQQKPRSKPHDIMNSNSKMKMKPKAPKKKGVKEADKKVRQSISNGELIKDEVMRLSQRDSRSLYIRFTSTNLPTSSEEIKKLHPEIKFVRTPRVKQNGDKIGFGYAFVEFGSEADCKAAKTKLGTTQFKGSELYVDFVGEKSKKMKGGAVKDKASFNPTRLFVSGLVSGVTKTNLKEMFPKSASADIPISSRKSKKATSYGFVQFSSPSDAKAAFDAAQNLEISGHPITVLFAKRTEQKDEVVKKKKAEKRKIREEKRNKAREEKKVKGTQVKKPKMEKEAEEENDEESEDENDDDDDGSEEENEVAEGNENEDVEDDENDEDSDEEDEDEDTETKEDQDQDEEDDDDDDDEDEDEEEEEEEEDADTEKEEEDDDNDNDSEED